MQPEIQYQNREIDDKFENLSTLIREKHDDVMIKISGLDLKVSYTNGRVRWLEKMVYLAIGGLGVLSIIVLPLIWALISSNKI